MANDWVGWLLCAVGVVVWVALSRNDGQEFTYADWMVDDLISDYENIGVCFPCDGDTMTVGCE